MNITLSTKNNYLNPIIDIVTIKSHKIMLHTTHTKSILPFVTISFYYKDIKVEFKFLGEIRDKLFIESQKVDKDKSDKSIYYYTFTLTNIHFLDIFSYIKPLNPRLKKAYSPFRTYLYLKSQNPIFSTGIFVHDLLAYLLSIIHDVTIAGISNTGTIPLIQLFPYLLENILKVELLVIHPHITAEKYILESEIIKGGWYRKYKSVIGKNVGATGYLIDTWFSMVITIIFDYLFRFEQTYLYYLYSIYIQSSDIDFFYLSPEFLK